MLLVCLIINMYSFQVFTELGNFKINHENLHSGVKVTQLL